MFKCVPHVRYGCRSCGCRFRPNSRWEWIGNTIGGALWATFFLLAWFGVLRWSIAAILIASVFALGFTLFPYITRFDLVHETDTQTNTSA